MSLCIEKVTFIKMLNVQYCATTIKYSVDSAIIMILLSVSINTNKCSGQHYKVWGTIPEIKKVTVQNTFLVLNSFHKTI